MHDFGFCMHIITMAGYKPVTEIENIRKIGPDLIGLPANGGEKFKGSGICHVSTRG